MATLAAEYTPERERARDASILTRAQRSTPEEPLCVLCPREPRAEALERALARRGGGFLLALDWAGLAQRLEHRAGIPQGRAVSEPQRAAWVERALAGYATRDRHAGLSAALEVDGFGVASALLSVLDELRLCGLGGSQGTLDATVRAALATLDEDDPVRPLLQSHLALLVEMIAALEGALERAGAVDHPARLSRLCAHARAAQGALSLGVRALYVTAVEQLAPLEREVLEAIRRGDSLVDVAPWVFGWSAPSPRPFDDERPAASALEAFGRMPECEPFTRDDASVRELSARDPDDEADVVARRLASLDEDARGRTRVLLPAEPGYAARVARALERHGLEAGWSSSEPGAAHPLWQVVRASVRLGWTGPDAVDLATVLSAPGGGIWGADRDRLCASLRKRRPTRWDDVRALLDEATDPERVLRDESSARPGHDEAPREHDVGEGALDDEALVEAPRASAEGSSRSAVDLHAIRAQQLLETRARVSSLIELWSRVGPFARLDAAARIDSLRELTEHTLQRFSDGARFREAFDGARVAAAWTAAARSIADAVRAVRAAREESGVAPRASDPADFLAPVERLLGSVPDAPRARRADVVRLACDANELELEPRPETLIVLAFHHRGTQSATRASRATRLLLGPVEVDALRAGGSRVVAGLAELGDEGVRARLQEREVRRALALPTRSLVLIAPLRDAQGERTEPALARRTLLRAYAEPVASLRLRAPLTPAGTWAREHEVATLRAQLDDAARALRAGELAPLFSLAERHPREVHELLAARLRPSRDYRFGDLLRERVDRDAFSPNALETLLKCRYAFATNVVLSLRVLALARGPSLALRDRTETALAALRALGDAPEPDVAEADREALEAREQRVAEAVECAIAERAPALGASLLRDELRREVRGFVDRYRAVRETLGAHGARHVDPTTPPGIDRPQNPRTAIRVGGEGAGERTIHVAAEVPRVELVQNRDGATEGVLISVRGGALEKLATQRSGGLGLHAALAPAVAEKALGVPIAAVASVAFNKLDAELVARSDRVEDLLPTRTSARPALRVARDTTLEEHRARVEARLGEALEQLVGERADASPHTTRERRALVAAQATSCEYCASKLLCRFREGGDEPDGDAP